MKTKILINGYGRIGRLLHRIILENDNCGFEVGAINSRADPKSHAYLLKYDSVYGTLPYEIKSGKDSISINGTKTKVYVNKKPGEINLNELGIDVVVECTGKFKDKESCKKQLEAGAKKVVISAPGKGEDISIVMGINNDLYDPDRHSIISNASCTTNCLAPVIKVLDKHFGVEYGQMTTIHAVTRTQTMVDASNSRVRRGRSAINSMIPTSTGASEAIGKIFTHLDGKIKGISVRVPFATVSLVDLVVSLEKGVKPEDLNKAFEKESKGDLRGILGISNEPLVSVDYVGESRSAVVDGLSTSVANSNFAKILAWYDNEWGYTTRLFDLVTMISSQL